MTNSTADKILLSKKERKQNRAHYMFGQMKVPHAILKIGIPSIIGMLVMGLYTFFDSFMAQQLLSDEGYSIGIASSKINPIATGLMSFGFLFALGGATRFSVALGQKNPERQKEVAAWSFFIGLVVVILMTLVTKFSLNAIWSAQAISPNDPAITNYAVPFLNIYLWGSVIQFLFMFITNFLRSDGLNGVAAGAYILSSVVNIILDYFFMSPHMANLGYKGGALATTLAWVIGLIYVLIFYFRNITHGGHFIISPKYLRGGGKTILLVMLIGLTPFARNFGNSITSTVGNHFLSNLPSHPISWNADAINQWISGIKAHGGWAAIPDSMRQFLMSHGIHNINELTTANLENVLQQSFGSQYWQRLFAGVMPMLMLFFMPSFGIIQASRGLIAYNYGAKNKDRVIQGVWWTIIMAVSYFIIATIIIMLSGHAIAAGFNVKNNAQVGLLINGHMTQLGSMPTLGDDVRKVIYIMFWSLPVYGIQFGAMTFFQSTNRIVWSVFMALLRGVIIEIPSLFLLYHIAHANNNAWLYFWGYPVMDVVSTLIVIPIMFWALHELKVKGFKKDGDEASNMNVYKDETTEETNEVALKTT